jgi:hypothetical protein
VHIAQTPKLRVLSDRFPGGLTVISMWFGNFFEPFFSDRESVARGIADVAGLGFDCICLDSKPWEAWSSPYSAIV